MSYKNITETYSLTYDDISLLPDQISAVESRSNCDTSAEFLGVKLDIPIIGSPMNTVTGGRMAKSLADLKCLGVIHRFNTIEEQIEEFEDYQLKDSEFKSAAVGINKKIDIDRLKKLADYGLILEWVYGYPKKRVIMINVDCLEKLQNDMKKDNEDWSKLQEKMRVRHEEIVQAANHDKDLWLAGLRGTTGLRVEE